MFQQKIRIDLFFFSLKQELESYITFLTPCFQSLLALNLHWAIGNVSQRQVGLRPSEHVYSSKPFIYLFLDLHHCADVLRPRVGSICVDPIWLGHWLGAQICLCSVPVLMLVVPPVEIDVERHNTTRDHPRDQRPEEESKPGNPSVK